MENDMKSGETEDEIVADLSHVDFSKISVDETLKLLKTSNKGLTENEARERLKKYGYNEIPEEKPNPVLKFLSYFWGPIPWMIEAAATISAAIGHWTDFGIITTLLLLNGIVAFWQENKAQSVISLLKQKLAINARVLRNGELHETPSRELVPGDVIRLRIGDIIPADVKLIEGDYLSADESTLTGESMPVDKKLGDIAYSGSVVVKGEMAGAVTSTGMNTFFGKTVQLVEEAETVSSFQKMVLKVGDYLILMALALVSITFLVAIYRQESILEMLRFALVLIVAAIPAAMPAVLSITMAIGALNLAKRQAVVTKLVSIEELAGVDILCSDKTGTLTKNELTTGELLPFNNYEKEDVIFYGALASEKNGDAIDDAIFRTLDNTGQKIEEFEIKNFIPFDPVIKRTEALVFDQVSNETFRVSKGAPQVILELCNQNGNAQKIVEEFAEKGYRTLGVARTKEDRWELVGLIPLFDPPRDDAASAVKTIKELGVKIKMLTGDNTAIAKHIADILGIGGRICPAREILKLKRETEVEALIDKCDGFSEVFPEHKYRIVEYLQKKEHLIAMTGDGVNDAPALKKANCGIAVSSSTDAARAASDVFLLEPGLSVIADAIKEARRIFQRMESYVIYRITETIRVLFFIVLSILVFNFYPITAVMIVLLALLNDAPILAIAYDNVKEMKEPARWNLERIMLLSILLGFVGVFSSFILFYIGDIVLSLPRPELQSFIFLKLAVAGHLTIFVTRIRDNLWKGPFPGKILLWSAFFTKILATIVVAYGIFVTPIGWELAALIWGYSLIWMFIADTSKVLFLKRLGEF